MKYLGGKGRIANTLAGEFNKIISMYNIKNYYEPFVGGAAVIELVNCQNRFGSDLNHYQIALLEHIKQYGSEGFPDFVSREEWEAVRENNDNYPDWYVGFIGTICSFNCIWFEGYGAEFTDKHGKKIKTAETFRNALKNTKEQFKLQSVQLSICDYRDIKIKPGSLVYCDPPYFATTDYFAVGSFDNNAFYNWVKEIAKHSVVYISEYMLPTDFKEIMSFELVRNCRNTVDGINNRTERLYVVKGGYLVDEIYGNKSLGYNVAF